MLFRSHQYIMLSSRMRDTFSRCDKNKINQYGGYKRENESESPISFSLLISNFFF